ncbi:TIGR02391 family protein [Kitasatospora sp. NPDC088264]|uniref:TIGR02391 family protein n=1 Tax=Kitasatospora sp. NPDC088264 TaxID=3155296 RepID=UPI003423C4B4
MRITAPEGMPRPEGDDGFELLETVWAWFSHDGRWPTYDDLDRSLYQRGIDTAKAIQQLPPDLVWGIDAGVRVTPQDEQLVQLTAAGLANCAEAASVLRIMLLLLQQAIEIERDWWPTGEWGKQQPSIDFETFAAGRDPNHLDRRTLGLAAQVAFSEPWATSISSGARSSRWGDPDSSSSERAREDYWELSFDKRVRKFAGIARNDLSGYWKLRQQLIGRPEALTVEEAVGTTAVEPEPEPLPVLALNCALHSEIAAVSAGLMEKGEYAFAVLAAYKAVEHRVQQLTGLTSNGHNLMGAALSPPNVRITVTRSTDANLESEQRGMAAIFSGVMQALRNPRAHGPNKADELAEAAETLVLASWLMRRLDIAEAAQVAASKPVAP